MSACSECLARATLLRRLAGHIDKLVDRGAGERARDLLALSSADLASAATSSASAARRIRTEARSAAGGLEEELVQLECRSICRHTREWPTSLGLLGDAAPYALFIRGSEHALGRLADRPAVSIVGARRAGTYGRDVTTSIAAELSAAGVTIISGLAFGVDTSAHEGGLRGGGLTVAVLGTGPERAYPRSRQALYRQIADRGLIVSELPPASPTFRWMFPARNRIMAALGGMTVVVEAAERSGSLITTDMAADLGRPVGAVPGPVDSWRSAGTNRLLAEGAAVIRDARDVLDCLLGPGAGEDVGTAAHGPPVGADAERLVNLIAGEAITQDELARRSGLGPASVAAAVVELELAGYVLSDAVGRIRRSQLTLGDPFVGRP